jgi:hypothetical protein
MCTPASAFAVVALRSLPRSPLPRPCADAPADPLRRRGPGLLLAALLAWCIAGRQGRPS